MEDRYSALKVAAEKAAEPFKAGKPCYVYSFAASPDVITDLLNRYYAQTSAMEAQQEVIRKQEWISVDQELPPYGQLVMVVWNGVVQKITYSRDIGEWVPWDRNSDNAPDGTFSHWMPLPAPPELKEPK